MGPRSRLTLAGYALDLIGADLDRKMGVKAATGPERRDPRLDTEGLPP